MLQQYCSKCGRELKPGDIFYADLDEWRREYREAKAKGEPLPPLPESGYTKCCHADPLWPPAPEPIPPPAPSNERTESTDFGAMIKLCNAIGKSPKSIKAYLRLDKIPSLFGPSVYFIDVRAKRFMERLDEALRTPKEVKGGNPVPMTESERVSFQLNDLLPMPPDKGPPFPSALGIKWPGKK